MLDKEKQLIHAIKNSDIDSIKKILGSVLFPLKINLHDYIDEDKYYTPWHWAYRCDSTEILKILLEHKADPNQRLHDLNEETVLFGQIVNMNIDTIKLLIESKADLNINNSFEKTVLDYASFLNDKNEHDDVVNLLIEKGGVKGNHEKRKIKRKHRKPQ